MKEYEFKSGGRYVFNEDFQNLQDLALSVTSLFKDSGLNFVICGCTVSHVGNNAVLSEGYVFLDNKIRKVEQSTHSWSSFVSSSERYVRIYAAETDGPTIYYADGTNKKQYTEYGVVVKWGNTLSGSVAYIEKTVNDSGVEVSPFPNLRSAWFKHYCPVMDSFDDSDDFKLISGSGGNVPSEVLDSDKFGTSIATELAISGMSLPNENGGSFNVPIFSINDVLAMRKAIITKLAVNDYAWLNNVRIENLKIGDLSLLQYIGNAANIEHVRLVAKMRNNSPTGTAINTLKAIVTDYHLFIRGTVTRAQLDGGSGTNVLNQLNLYLPNSVIDMLALDYYAGNNNSQTAFDDVFKCYVAPYQLGNIYYISQQQNADPNTGQGYAPSSFLSFFPNIIIRKNGKLEFSELPGTGNYQYPHVIGTRNIEFAVTFDRVPTTMPDDYSE